MTRITGTLHENEDTFLIISRSLLLRTRHVSYKRYTENQNTNCIFNSSFFPENRDVYEIMWKNIVELGRLQVTKWRMRIGCCTAKAANTHSEYVILIALTWKQWLRECVSMLRLYVQCLCFLFLKTQRYASSLLTSSRKNKQGRKYPRILALSGLSCVVVVVVVVVAFKFV